MPSSSDLCSLGILLIQGRPSGWLWQHRARGRHREGRGGGGDLGRGPRLVRRVVPGGRVWGGRLRSGSASAGLILGR